MRQLITRARFPVTLGRHSLPAAPVRAVRMAGGFRLERGLGPGAWLAALLVGAAGTAAAAAAEPPERAAPAASCVTAECHPAVAAYPQIHWSDATAPGQCQRCHQQDGDLHEFETEDPPELCGECHEELLGAIEAAEVIHEPAEEDCLDCHNPHGGDTPALLEEARGEDLRRLCFTCHERAEVFHGEHRHQPVAEGTCSACHDPHASRHRRLLRARETELCAECHEQLLDRIDSAEHVHDPAEDDCLDCHDPHSEPHPNLLFAPGRKLCAECHDEVVAIAEGSKVPHGATTTEDECVNCHSPHASDHKWGLKGSQREVCLECHDRRIPSERGMLADIKAVLDGGKFWHEPVREKDCTHCHKPHGSDYASLLDEAFPASFYSAFSPEAYAFCFSCHEPSLVTEKSTRSLTGFRDGDRNLHFLHVNKARRGRSCRACHDFHASRWPSLLRESTRFGAWMMPIGYQPSETGGSCAPGCHEKLAYDREATDAAHGD